MSVLHLSLNLFLLLMIGLHVHLSLISITPPPRLPFSTRLARLRPVLLTSQWTQPSGPHHDFGQRPRSRTSRYTSPPVSSCQFVQRRDYDLALPTYVASCDGTCTVHRSDASCSRTNQRTRVLIERLGLNVVCFLQFTSSISKVRASCIVSSLAPFIFFFERSYFFRRKDHYFHSSTTKGMIFLYLLSFIYDFLNC